MTTTALHNAVVANRYLAVECLVRSGFVVDALDHRGLNTFALASSFHNRLRLPAEKRENDRIVVFLQQGMGMRQRRRSNGIWDLPQGWESVGMDTSPKAFDTNRKSLSSVGLEQELDVKKQSPESKPSIEHFTDLMSISTMRQIRDDQEFFYQERHTDSITLKRPKVSIIEDRRLSLGFQAITGARKVVGSENQVYGLDLIPFSTATHHKTSTTVFRQCPGIKMYQPWEAYYWSQPSNCATNRCMAMIGIPQMY